MYTVGTFLKLGLTGLVVYIVASGATTSLPRYELKQFSATAVQGS